MQQSVICTYPTLKGAYVNAEKNYVRSRMYFVKSPDPCTCTYVHQQSGAKQACSTAVPGTVGPAQSKLYKNSVEFWLYDSL
jgi:hypothetical protein